VAEQFGTALDADALDELFMGTGGWPYGVLNVLRRYGERTSPATLAQVLATPDRAARQYVSQEVLGQLPRRIKDAALALAGPDAFSAALTDALTGGHDGAWVIDELASSGLLGYQGARDDVAIYKFPAFFRACLRSELHSRAPGNEERLLGTAAEWSLRSGDLLAAVEYHLRAGHFENAAELMTEHAYELYRAGQAPDVLRLARPFLWPLSRANEAVTLCLAAMSLVAGEATAAEELLLEFDKGPCDDPELSKWADGLRCLLIEFHAPAQDVLDRAQSVLGRDDVAREDHLRDGTGPRHAALLTGIAYLGGGQALAGLDRHEEAWRWYKAGLADVHLPPELRAKLLGALARSEAIAGQLTAAQRHANQSLALISDLGAKVRRTLGHAETYLGLAIVALEQGGQGWQEAVPQLLDDAEERARLGRRTNLLAGVALHRARLFLLVGRPDEGLALLAGLRTSGNPDPAPGVESRLLAVEAELLIANGQHAKAAYVLRAAPLETSDVLAVRAYLAVEAHNRGSLVQCVRSWPDVSRRPRARVLKLLCQAAADALGGLAQDAHRHLDDAIRQARLEGLNQVFSENGNAIFRLVARPHPTTQRSPDAARPAPPPATPQASDVAITSQELVVLRALATGASNRALATSLFISTNTLKTHLQHIYSKLGVTNRFQAVRRATALGLLADPSEPATTEDPR
jgi:LuxR family maltose regulon positive regulatory protein